MATLNDITILGRIGKDAGMRFTPAGKEVTTFSVAVTRSFDKEQTDWFDVEMWGKLAEAANQHCLKGREVIVQGRIQFDKWKDKEGNNRTSTKLVASGFQITDWLNDRYGNNGDRLAMDAQHAHDALDIPMA